MEDEEVVEDEPSGVLGIALARFDSRRSASTTRMDSILPSEIDLFKYVPSVRY